MTGLAPIDWREIAPEEWPYLADLVAVALVTPFESGVVAVIRQRRRGPFQVGPNHMLEVSSAWTPGYLPPDPEVRAAVERAGVAMRYVFDAGSPGEVAADAKVRCTRFGRAGEKKAQRTWQRIENDARREEPLAEALLAELAEERAALADALLQQLEDFRRGGSAEHVVAVASALVDFVGACPWARLKRRHDEQYDFAETSGAGEVSERQERRRRAELREYFRATHPSVGSRARNMSKMDISEYRSRNAALLDIWNTDSNEDEAA